MSGTCRQYWAIYSNAEGREVRISFYTDSGHTALLWALAQGKGLEHIDLEDIRTGPGAGVSVWRKEIPSDG